MGLNALLLITLLPSAVPAAGFSGLADTAAFASAARELEVPGPKPGRTHDGNVYASTACARLELPAGAAEAGPAELSSTIFVEECRPLPPNDLGLSIEHCYSRPLKEWNVSVRLRRAESAAFPSGTEVFEACLSGWELSLRPVSAYGEYEVGREENSGEILLLLKPAGPARPEK